ncbi:MAG: alpha/beta hydrolase [Luteibaculaceae bacterium]
MNIKNNPYFYPSQDFESVIFSLKPDYEGVADAVLLIKRPKKKQSIAVLYVHGFLDYFFQGHLADFLTNSGVDFYALDLRKYGRSILPHQKPNFCKNLEEYFEEIDMAISKMQRDGITEISLLGHSTGGLILSYYLHKTQDKRVNRLILNSPFLDFYLPDLLKKGAIPVLAALGEKKPFTEIPFDLTSIYTHSIHKNFKGKWDFNLAWKPPKGFPLYAGWFFAIHKAQEIIKADGYSIKQPIDLFHAEKSHLSIIPSKHMYNCDIVLDVDDFKQLGPKLGKQVQLHTIKNGIHDLALSEQEPRQAYFNLLLKSILGKQYSKELLLS